MNLKVSNYSNCIPILRSTVVNNIHRDLNTQLALSAVATNVPIVAITYLYEQLYGSSDELLRLRKVFMDFYKYSSVEL